MPYKFMVWCFDSVPDGLNVRTLGALSTFTPALGKKQLNTSCFGEELTLQNTNMPMDYLHF